LKIHPRDLNNRFFSLKKPFNSHCKTNYVDYNCVVDQILQMSLPYCDTKTGATYVNKQNNNYINAINIVSNLSNSAKEEKNKPINKMKVHSVNPCDNGNIGFKNNIKDELSSANMSPISQKGRNEDLKYINSKSKNKIIQ